MAKRQHRLSLFAAIGLLACLLLSARAWMGIASVTGAGRGNVTPLGNFFDWVGFYATFAIPVFLLLLVFAIGRQAAKDVREYYGK